jgi:hypothetical protein
MAFKSTAHSRQKDHPNKVPPIMTTGKGLGSIEILASPLSNSSSLGRFRPTWPCHASYTFFPEETMDRIGETKRKT